MKSRINEENLKSIVVENEPKDQEAEVDIDEVDPHVEVPAEE